MSDQSPLPRLSLEGLKDKSPKDYAIRFAFGASISLIAALVSLKFQLLGGMFLAFPAILPPRLPRFGAAHPLAMVTAARRRRSKPIEPG